MATKNEQNAENNKSIVETWRKPLQVPPRTNAMRSFYQGDEIPNQVEMHESSVTKSDDEVAQSAETGQESDSKISSKNSDREVVETDSASAPKNTEVVAEASRIQGNKLTEAELSVRLGFEMSDLYDISELLRGKSFDIYRILMKARDEKGRCKITQPELMKRAAIKNRRTFYKHEERLINLRLLEKRHLPGDHKGVVYRVFELKDVLPVPIDLLEQFTRHLEDVE